jgi:hypothetical protein
MFSTIQIIILVILTLLLFILRPYLIILREKKLNQNRIQKISPKRKIIFNLFIGIIVISLSARLMYVYNDYKDYKEIESKPVPTPQIETKEYYYKKGEYDTKHLLTEENKNKLCFNEQEKKWMLYNGGEISEPLIETKYTFFGFNGFDQCQHKDKIPKDLAPFIREPFNNWCVRKYFDSERDRTDYFNSAYFYVDYLNKDCRESVFNMGFLKMDKTIKMDYTGPKYLLEEDKDFYVNEVKCPLKENQKRWDEAKKIFKEVDTDTYYLHFNPKKQYITLYTEKLNIKK